MRGLAEGLGAGEGAGPHKRFDKIRTRGARDADARQLHAALRDHEIEQAPGESVLAGEREDRAQRHAVETDDVERAESEEHAGREREEAHDDVVGEDGHRQHG